MNIILQVIGNLKHDGTTYGPGDFIEASEGQFAQLIEAGLLRVVEGAKSVAEAAELVGAEVAAGSDLDSEVKAEAPNTWGPKKDPIVAADDETKAPEAEGAAPVVAADAPVLAKFNVLKSFEVTNADSKNFGKHAVGEVIEAEPARAQSLIDSGILALVTEPTGDNL